MTTGAFWPPAVRQCKIVEVLDIADGPQAAHGGADRLAENGRLPDPRVGEAQVAVLCLQSLEHEVHITQPPDVLADHEKARVTREIGVEVAQQYLAAIDGRRLCRIDGGNHRYFERGLIGGAVDVRAVALGVLALVVLDELAQLCPLRRIGPAQRAQRE